MRSTGSRRPLILAIAAVFVVTLFGLQLLRGGDEPAPQPPASAPPAQAESARLSDVVDTLTIPRGPFCEAIDPEVVEAAVGGPITKSRSYDNGDPVEVGKLSDVSHEYGCQWEGGDSTTARAWVFVPPVTVKEARSMISAARDAPGCRRVGASYGGPSVGLVCAGKARQQASYRGLFGDTWLTCTLTAPSSVRPAQLSERTDRWCAEVAVAAGG